MLIGLWDTSTFESDEGTYVLRMELFDDAGNKITTAQFPDHGGNGSGIDPDPVPVSTGHLDLKVHVDNKPMTFSLTTPAINDCGVIPWSSVPPLDFYVHAAQENGRVNSWSLQYTKGVNPTRLSFVGGSMSYASGIGLVNQPVNGNILLSEPVTVTNPNGELQSTCAFALILNAWLHVRGNWGFIWAESQEKVYAIAIEKCPQCPDQ